MTYFTGLPGKRCASCGLSHLIKPGFIVSTSRMPAGVTYTPTNHVPSPARQRSPLMCWKVFARGANWPNGGAPGFQFFVYASAAAFVSVFVGDGGSCALPVDTAMTHAAAAPHGASEVFTRIFLTPGSNSQR